LRETQRSAADADARLEALQQRQNDVASAVTPNQRPDERSVVMVDNPQWNEAVRRLGELEERRRVLLFERTPLHPSVQEIEMRISDLRREMAAIPPKIAQAAGPWQNPPLASRLPPPPPAELDAARQTAATMHRQVEQSDAAAHAALAARTAGLRIDLVPAETVPEPATPVHTPATLLAAALAAATSSVIGLALISYGASLAPAVSNISELQALLPVPVLGVVPATDGLAPPPSTRRRRAVRCATIVAGLLVLLAIVCVLVRT
jgi:hypothetical protein